MSHRIPRLLTLALLCVALPSLGCKEDDGPGTDPPVDGDLYPLSDPSALREGAPANEDLPPEGKADEVLPRQYNLVSTQSRVQSQGSRGVCSIFATIGLMEHLYIAEGTLTAPDFSEQFLQWSTKVEMREFQTTSGSSAKVNIDTLNRYGTVFETDWPYQSRPWGASDDARCTGEESSQPVICHTNGDPPAAAMSATRWRIPRGRWINSRASSIKSQMYNAHTAVQVGGDFYYQAWGHGGSRIPVYRGYRDLGYVVTPNAEDIRSSGEHRAGHSVLLVGWDDDLEVQAVAADGTLAVNADGTPVMQRGFFLFKNSWGTGWATRNPHGAGYGWISYDYVEDYMSAYASGIPEVSLTEVCNDARDNDYNGQTDCADAACASDRACFDPMGRYENTTGIDVPDGDATGIGSTIEVTEAGILSSVSVEVDITHPYRGDLTVQLVKDSRTVTLHERTGAGEDDLKKTWEVRDFDGDEASGIWTLRVIDGVREDVGRLNRWALAITRCAGDDCGSTPTTLTGTNDASRAIPDGDPAGISSNIPLTGAGTVSAARVTVRISHPFLADLVIAVSKDGGARTELLREHYVEDTVLERTFAVDAFNGMAAAGTWTLHVADVAGGDQGTLERWSLEVVAE